MAHLKAGHPIFEFMQLPEDGAVTVRRWQSIFVHPNTTRLQALAPAIARLSQRRITVVPETQVNKALTQQRL